MSYARCVENKILQTRKSVGFVKRDLYRWTILSLTNTQESIQVRSRWFLKSFTEQNGRYHHPEIAAKDIAEQKAEVKLQRQPFVPAAVCSSEGLSGMGFGRP